MVNEIGINSLETTKSLLGIAGVAGEDKETIKPYATLIAAATSIINETIQIYENAEYNKKICNALMDRVQIANGVIKTLNRRKQENEKNFRNELYYKNFVRFVDILGRIKDFIKDVSQLQGYKKYLLANSIKDKFNNLTNDFESVMKDLNFTMSEEQKAIDREALEEGIQELKKQMEEKEKQGEERRIISSLIPTERLFIIRSNIKQFLKKWSKKTDNNLFEKLFLKSTLNDLDKLRSPEQIGNYWYLNIPQWGSRITAGVGGVLALKGYSELGGSMAAVAPVVDVVTTKMKENFYDNKEKKWNEFLTDADTFSDNFNELLGIVRKIDSYSELGRTNQIVKDLKERTEELLEIYDEDEEGKEGYGEIDLEELTDKDKRTKLAQDLAKDKKESKWWKIIEDIRKLEDIVVTYQKDDSTIEELRQKISEAESKKANQSKNQAKETHEEALRAEKFASSESWLTTKLKAFFWNRKTNNTHLMNQNHSVVIISATDDEEKNGQSLNNSQAKLLNKFQKGNEETNELVEQPLQIQPPYGTPGSSKPN